MPRSLPHDISSNYSTEWRHGFAYFGENAAYLFWFKAKAFHVKRF